jgi:hypothetical protein
MKLALACAGSRIASVPSHHRLTFEGAKLAIAKPAVQLADYFDARRAQAERDRLHGSDDRNRRRKLKTSRTCKAFLEFVERWIESSHPKFKRLMHIRATAGVSAGLVASAPTRKSQFPESIDTSRLERTGAESPSVLEGLEAACH